MEILAYPVIWKMIFVMNMFLIFAENKTLLTKLRNY